MIVSARFKEFWYYFKENKGAVVGLVIVSIFLLMALLADLIAPYSPSD